MKPSELTEGGRRIYSEDDLKKLRCICLYKALGFSLEEIKKVTCSSEAFKLLYETILNQQGKIENEIQQLSQTKERLNAILEQIEETGNIKVESIDEMDSMLNKKNKHRKTDIMTYAFISCYVLVLCAGFPLAVSVGGIFPFIMTGAAIILLFSLIYYHSQVNAYVCPKCHEKFSIGFFKDMFSLNGGKKGKYLKCPHCGRRGWIKETFPE